jgi:hypothetical protein
MTGLRDRQRIYGAALMESIPHLSRWMRNADASDSLDTGA